VLQSKKLIKKEQNHMNTLRETFLEELADLYDAEKQIDKGLEKMIKAAEHEDLKSAFEAHREETQTQIERLEQVFEIFEEAAKGKKCKAMQGLLKEAEDMIKEDAGDAALICGAQKVEHYEIASYGSLVSWARLMGEDDAADLLEETLDEEKETDEKLTQLAESVINIEENEEEGEEEEEEEGKKAK
jgi:ferritin-like metal-binding protein YciE